MPGSASRKVVTVLFTDVAGSTALGEQLDPELLRNVMWRYFEAVQEVLERHGGTVEKFIGDAVMAVFGVPAVHEDDPVRAVRAAGELGGALGALNDELAREHGLEIVTRTGVNTGEVVVGGGAPDQKLATGDAVNVAARLEQAAAPGEVLLGAATYAAVADLVEVDGGRHIDAKGKAEPLLAYPLVGLRADAPPFARPVATPFVGRRDELERLRAAFERAVATRSAVLATIVGTPGIGKSRLARELLDSVAAEARILIGRCAAYGDGVPYLPLADAVRDAGDLGRLFTDVEHGELAARLLAGAVGAGEGGGSPDETAWAFRRLCEVLAATRPLVLVVDDIHWADTVLLDLIEYVAASASDAPLFVLCTSRADLFDGRPSWAAPRPGTELIALEPLDATESDELVEALAPSLSPDRQEHLIAVAEGNPLFVEQLVAFVADAPEAGIMPPSIQSLLAARLDRLEPEERAVVQHASLEGRLFHRGAVGELLDDGAAVGGLLLALTRKQFVHPARSLFPADDGYRFNHVLIRDVAYASLPKELRSRLHARLADWLEGRRGHLAAADEIVGYHLEQAYRLGAEVGRRDDGLAVRAGRLLRRAGETAADREEPAAATTLLRRASDLLASEPGERAGMQVVLGRVLRLAGDLPQADAVLAEAIDQAREHGDVLAELRAAMERGHLRYMQGTADADELRQVAQRAIATFEADVDLADAWQHLALAELRSRNRGAQLEAMKRAQAYAVASGDVRRQIAAWNELGGAMVFGRTPLSAIKPFIDEQLEWAREHDLPAVEADALLAGPYIHARLGDFEAAREMLDRSKEICRDLGLAYGLCEAGMAGGELEVQAGDLEAAERELRSAIEIATAIDAAHYVGLYQVRLARVLNDQDRHDEAAALLDDAAMLYADSPPWKSNRARALAAQGKLDEAVVLAREAATLEAGNDDITAVAQTLADVAEVLLAAGDRAGADAALIDAIALHEQKGNIVWARRYRDRLGKGVEPDGD
jgi:class 3 adenylate cyclase/tetratricopeptide (TPR) repeat protein